MGIVPGFEKPERRKRTGGRSLACGLSIAHGVAPNGPGRTEPLSRLRLNDCRHESFHTIIPFAMLAVESVGVIALRMMKLMSGGSDALCEAELMVSEKVHAAVE